MRFFVKLLIVVAVLGGIGFVGYKPVMDYLAKRNRLLWRTAKSEYGNIVSVVNSTGTVKPKLKVAIGSFVSGPILKLYCEFNQEVKEGDLLAEIDPRIYQAGVSRDQAAMASREADVFRVQAQLQQAINDEKRAVATLENSLANLNYTKIKAPVDGIVIDRKIDPGQTLAAQFQTPELFVIAPDMREEMHIHASVDEADIGLIKAAQHRKYEVTFTVDAYPEKLFKGRIHEIRMSSTTVQNVVTYPVIVSTPNPELELLPGMTASLSFQVEHRDDVIKIPNAALRYYPNPKQVRPADLPILEGQGQNNSDETQESSLPSEKSVSADERSKLRRDRHRRHVWIADGDLLRAVEVQTGLSDSQFSEMISGDLKANDALVIGVQATQFGPPK